jgi:hypothetical protein
MEAVHLLDVHRGKAIAIGAYAGSTFQNDYSIVINATGTDLNTGQASSLYIAPIRTIETGSAGSLLAYNTTSKEIQYASSVTMSGSISASAYYSSSDARLKKNLQPFPSVLEHLRNIQPCRFTWKSNDKPDYGFITQQQFLINLNFLKRNIITQDRFQKMPLEMIFIIQWNMQNLRLFYLKLYRSWTKS